MTREPDVTLVVGTRVRYACRSVTEVDSHLTALLEWMAVTLPKLPDSQRRTLTACCGQDVDRLLNARTMLAAFETLDADLGTMSA